MIRRRPQPKSDEQILYECIASEDTTATWHPEWHDASPTDRQAVKTILAMVKDICARNQEEEPEKD